MGRGVILPRRRAPSLLTLFLRPAPSNGRVDPEVVGRKGLLHLQCVLASSAATTPEGALEQAAAALHAVHGIDPQALLERLSRRERRGSTVLGKGVAIPHADMWKLGRPQAAFVRLQRPCLVHRSLVSCFFVLVAPRPALAVDRAMLQYYSRLLVDDDFQRRLHGAFGATDLWRAFREAEWPRDASAVRPRKRGAAGAYDSLTGAPGPAGIS
ncbi:PTS transporter subunit EIIA [Ramlibacter terrae]|uniref:PTS transporter subunit EIIA n=1 Tax=Ramlibacter terrae TaxID=2732511 RepID=A0ABX6P6L9_9BURK|nr:PTS transporter subunit EIIA [Ramlibacter terrae]